jgi:hypothetical protein
MANYFHLSDSPENRPYAVNYPLYSTGANFLTGQAINATNTTKQRPHKQNFDNSQKDLLKLPL